MFKKIAVFVLTLAMLLCAFATAEENTQTIELGTSGLTMVVDASYVPGEISAEDTDENQVAYYSSETYLLDFDVYQWAKAEGETLASAAANEAALYEAECVQTEFNGVPAFYYETVEESEGVEYPTLTVLMENGDFIAEIVFWMDGENPDGLVEGMVNTIIAAENAEITDEGNVITLGTSSLKIELPYVFVKGGITEEDTDESQVAYYYSEETLVDFDVYQWAKAEGETLIDVAAAEAAEYDAEAVEVSVNDIPLVFYEAVEENEGVEYPTVTYLVEDGNDFVEIVFWLDGDNAADIVNGIINSLTR